MLCKAELLLSARVVAYGAATFYSPRFNLEDFAELLLYYNVTVAFTGGTSPGLKFTPEIDVDGQGTFKAITDVQATGNGYTANAVASANPTATGVGYRLYKEMFGIEGRIKVEVTGLPTGGTATITTLSVIGKRHAR